MQKERYYLLAILVLFVSCERIYHPAIEKVEGQLIVDAKITNDPAKSLVHLSKTRSFYDVERPIEISGAKVELVQMGGVAGFAVQASERNTGYYTFNTAPQSGNRYYLRLTIGSDVYESLAVTMPPIPALTNFYTIDKVSKIYVADAQGNPKPFEKRGREIDVDLPVNESLSHYRFDVRALLEWTWDSIPSAYSIYPTAYGWQSYYQHQNFNLAGPTGFNQVDQIKNHPLLLISYEEKDYLYTDTLASKGWILIIDQYGTSTESYEFHQQLNNQFAATGSLFDPVQTQVTGNILCKTDPTQIVYGYFDLNSYLQYRYYFNVFSPSVAPVIRQLYRFPDIPDYGFVKAVNKKPIVKPSWWAE